MTKRHVIYCDHCPDSVVEAGSNARERKPATVSHEIESKPRHNKNDIVQVIMAESASTSDWRDEKSTVRERISYFFNSEVLSDVAFLVDSLKIPAHKFVLAAGSSVFYAMFHGSLAETSNLIEVPDCECKEDFLEFLKFLYTDECDLSWENIFPVLYLSKKYLIQPLSRKCVEFMIQDFKKDTVLAVLQQSVKFEENGLKKRCLEYLNPIASDVIKMSIFTELDLDTLKTILDQDELAVSEVKLFMAVEKWCTEEMKRQGLQDTPSQRRNLLGDAFYSIRFPTMSSLEFSKYCAYSNLLTLEECRDLFCYIVNRENGDTDQTDEDTHDNSSRILFKKHKRTYARSFETLRRIGDGLGTLSGPWNYNGRNADALGFLVNKPIFLHGVILFGDANANDITNMYIMEDQSKTKLEPHFEIQKGNTFGIYLEDSTFNVVFTSPLKILSGRKYIISTIISGPPSREGNYQKLAYKNDDGVEFIFHDYMAKSSNSTSRSYGQFPGFLYSLSHCT